jgi:hypothetical protein
MKIEVLVWARESSTFISTFSSECPHTKWCHVTVMPASVKNSTDAVAKNSLKVHYKQVGTGQLWKCLTMPPNHPTTSHCGPFLNYPVHISTGVELTQINAPIYVTTA